MLSTFSVSFYIIVNNLGLYIYIHFFPVTRSEIAGVCNIAINHCDIIWCIAGDLQQRTAPERLPCGNALFFWLLGKSSCLQTLVVKCTWQSLQVWDDLCCSLISSWQLVSTTSAASMAPELHHQVNWMRGLSMQEDFFNTN